MAGVASWCLHSGVQPAYTGVYNAVSPHLRADYTPQGFWYLSLDASHKADFYTRCEMLNFQLILKLSLSILLTWCLKKQSPAPILASGTFAVEEGVGREELLPLVSVVSLLVPFGRGGEILYPPLNLFNFYGKRHKKDEIQLLGKFHRSEQMDFDSSQITKLNQLYFH